MARTLTKEEIFDLPVMERLDLIATVWDSMSPADIPIPESHQRELDAALDDLQRNPDAGETWESVRKDLSRDR